MLATAAIGSTGATLGATLPGLPGAAQAAVGAEAQAGVVYAAVGQVETVTVAVDGFTFALAPGAVAMSSPGTQPAGFRAWRSMSGFKGAMGPAVKAKSRTSGKESGGELREARPAVC